MAMSPSASLATLRPDLAQSFEAFDLEAQHAGFIGPKILPFIPVAEQAGNYGYVPPEQMLVQRQDTRAPGSGYNRSQATFKGLTYACREHGVEEAVDDREAKMYGNYFDAESFAARRARDAILRNFEQRVVAQLTDTTNNFPSSGSLSNYGVIGTAGTAGLGSSISWKTIATADPVTDVAIVSKAIYANSGLIPNKMIVSYNKFWDLRRNANVISQIKYSGLDNPKMEVATAVKILSELFGLELLVAGAQYNSANQGQSMSLLSIWPVGSVLFAKVPTSADFREACLGRTFHWSADGSSENGTVESYRDETVRSNIVRVRMDTDEQIILPQAAFLLTGVDA